MYNNLVVGVVFIEFGLTDYAEDNNLFYSAIDNNRVLWVTNLKGAGTVILTDDYNTNDTTFESGFFVNPDYSRGYDPYPDDSTLYQNRRMDLDYTPVNGVITHGHLAGGEFIPLEQ